MSRIDDALRLTHGEKTLVSILFGVLGACFLMGFGLSIGEAVKYGFDYPVLGGTHQNTIVPVWQEIVWMLLAAGSCGYSIHSVWRYGRFPMGRRIM